eukprot:tig00020961_g16701.t1
MAACQHALKPLEPPRLSTPVYKEECTQCFDGQDNEEGINVCLHCFNGGCAKHAPLHAMNRGHPIALNIKRILVKKAEARPQKITKVAIGVPGGAGAEADEYDFETKVLCFQCGTEVERTAGKLPGVIDGVVAAPTAAKQEELKAWENEISACQHTKGLQQDPAAPQLAAKSLAHCGLCELSQNLWLCLACGHLGCGRRNYDGTGGNGHAMDHYTATKHPVVCKLGTITPEGTADIYCYGCDDAKLDPQLAAHLARFGINVASQEKTEKSTAEMELDRNLTLDFSEATEDGQRLTPVHGPGYTGLRNMGNTCYMASVLQVLFKMPEFLQRYQAVAAAHAPSCREPSHAACYLCQMGKMADGLASGRYSQAPKDAAAAEAIEAGALKATSAPDAGGPGQEAGVAPRMLKALVGKDHAEFSTMRQQDALEFLQHLLKLVRQKEHAAGGEDPSRAFDFTVAQRVQCAQCRRARYSRATEQQISLPIPLPQGAEGSGAGATVPFEACVAGWAAEEAVEGFQCPACSPARTVALKSQRFETFPETLVCHMRRFVYDNWVPKKLDVSVTVPERFDFGAYMGAAALAPGEQPLPDAPAAAPAAPARPQADEASVEQLMAMGFPRPRCVRAVLATGNSGAETAMNWLFEHMEDPDIDAPLPEPMEATGPAAAAAAGGAGPSEESVSMLCDMGFTPAQARKALRSTDNNMERAVEWLFSHPGDTGEEAPAPAPAAAGSAGAPAGPPPAGRAGRGVYELVGVVTHKGPSVHCGHYIAHCRRAADGRWVLFNDNKVVEAGNPPLTHGYLYFFRRVD